MFWELAHVSCVVLVVVKGVYLLVFRACSLVSLFACLPTKCMCMCLCNNH